jgi:hypothetical protein
MQLFVAIMWVAALLIGRMLFDPGATIHGAPSMVEPAVLAVERLAEPRIDLYGNEITNAVGDYRVDPHGDLYERHAPDTAVLELGPPGA